jgi:hypothetical protein
MTTATPDEPPLNATTLADEPVPNFFFLGLAVVPIAAIVGNCLVVAAVWTTRSLQTSTNYLLVSLAVADLVVSAFVMPFSIYLSVCNLLILFTRLRLSHFQTPSITYVSAFNSHSNTLFVLPRNTFFLHNSSIISPFCLQQFTPSAQL